MQKTIITAAVAAVIGAALTLAILAQSAAGIMLLEDEARYDFDRTVDVFRQTTLDSGWKIPTVHDLQETMKSFGKDVEKVKVFELCHPDHAYLILKEDQERVVSALMPCRVAIYQKKDGKVYVSRLNSGLMGKMMKGVVPEVMGVAARETEEILQAVIK